VVADSNTSAKPLTIDTVSTVAIVPTVVSDPNATQDRQKLLQEKRIAARRTRDSLLRIQQAAAQAKTESKPVSAPEQTANRQEASVPAPKKMDIAQVTSQVTANANDYKVGVFGGLSRIEITVHNGSSVALEDVTIELSYISANDNVLQTKTIHSGAIGASSAQSIPAPSSNRGARIEWKIIQVKPKE
jgi:hypothetical protein